MVYRGTVRGTTLKDQMKEVECEGVRSQCYTIHFIL